MLRLSMVALAFLAFAGAGHAASKSIQYVPSPGWVAPPPSPTQTQPPEGAAIQTIYSDNQVRVGPGGDEFYSAYRFRVLASEGLAIGNIAASWSPNTDDLQVHALKVIRGGEVIDVLKAAKFQILQRENNLEYAVLDGQLTASLQVPGLRVGDELEFATTVRRKDPTLGARSQGAMVLPAIGSPGAYRMRLVWPTGWNLRWQATKDLDGLAPIVAGPDQVLTYELRDPPSAILAEGAPPRFNRRRAIQFSGFTNWTEVSNLFWGLYDDAAKLTPTSPIKAEAARIAAQTSDPAERAAAALALVEERIRYVAVFMGDGNYRPASADDTWARRFGDCKAKSVLLLALLTELGVPAEVALVNSLSGDGLDETLPMPAAFNHVIVRARVDGETYWLDATRTGDRRLELLPEPLWTWALPLRRDKSDLERIVPQPPLLALDGLTVVIDATAGFDTPAKVSAEQILRGDDAIAYKISLAQLSRADADRALGAYWREKYSWAEPEQTAWRYDDAMNATILTMTGEGTLEWEGEAETGRWLNVPYAGMSKPEELRRPREQDQAAPWMVGFPDFRRWTTVIRLPPAEEGWRWNYNASELDEKIGGLSYWRTADLDDGVLRTTMSIRALTTEITAAEAAEANVQRRDFDNKVSRVWLYREEAPAELTDAYNEAVGDFGKDASKLAGIGGEMAGVKMWQLALDAYDKALAIDPKLAPAISGKAWVLERRDGADAALRYLAKVKTDDPGLSLVRAQTLLRAGRREEAATVLRPAIAANADDAAFLGEAAQLALRAGDRELAIKAAETAVRLTPDDVTSRQVRAHVYAFFAEPRWAEALPDVEAALRLQPEHPVNLRNRANTYYHLGRIEDGLADIDEVLRIDPIDMTAIRIKARLLRKAGRPEAAVALLDTLVVSERDARSLNNRCWERALADLQLDGAETDCALALKLEPDNASYWDSYGLVALRRNDLSEALRRYDRAISLNPREATSLYARGLTKLRMGDENGGRADIAAATAIAPTAGHELREAGVTP